MTSEDDKTRIDQLRKQYATGACHPEGGSSSIEDQQCCTKMALSVVHKAWEGAKKAIPSKSAYKKESFPRSHGEHFDPISTGSYPYIDSDNEPPTEYSCDYNEDNGDLNRESVFQLRPGVFRAAKPIDSDSKVFECYSGSEDSDRATSEEGDLGKFKIKYMSGNVIPEETEEEIEKEKLQTRTPSEKRKNIDENKRTRKNRKLLPKNREDDDDSEDSKEDWKRNGKGSPKIEKYAKSTSEKLINLAKNRAVEERHVGSLTLEDKNCLADDERSVNEGTCEHPASHKLSKPEGIFRVKPRILYPNQRDSLDSRDSQMASSTDALESISCEMPTITITEDEFEDGTSCGFTEATLRSDDELSNYSEETLKAPKTKTEKLKSKMKEFGGKVKVMFGKHEKKAEKREPQESVNKEEDLKRLEEMEEKKKAELQLKLEENLKKEKERKALLEEEKQRKAEEAKKRLEADLMKREEALSRKEQELRRKAEEQKRKEEEKRKKEEEKRRKDEEKKRLKEQKEEEAKRKKAEEQRKKMEQSIAKIAVLEKKVKSENKADKSIAAIEHEEDAQQLEQSTLEINLKQDEIPFTTSTEVVEMESKQSEAVFPVEEVLEEETFENVKLLASASEAVPPKNDEHEYYNFEVLKRSSSHPLVLPSQSSPLELTSDEPRRTTNETGISTSHEMEMSDEDVCLQVDSEGDFEVEEKRVNKRKNRKFRVTKKKLKTFKNKALESLPSMQVIKSKMKDFFPKSGTTEVTIHEYEKVSIPRDQQLFDEYKQRYPDDGFFSDSELVECRKSTARRQKERITIEDQFHFYEEVSASGPLRPPRRYERRAGFGLNAAPAMSEPSISNRFMISGRKRIPPPRPPPPENLSSYEPSLVDTELMNEIDLDKEFDSISKSDRIPPHLFYRSVRENWQEKNVERLAELISRSTPNLKTKSLRDESDVDGRMPKPKPKPARPPLPDRSVLYQKTKVQSTSSDVIAWKPPTGKQPVYQTRYEPVGEGLPPRRPPRMRRRFASFRSPQAMSKPDKAILATDPLYWKAFAWKTGRCRSLTELYLRKKELPVNNGHKLENTPGYRLTIKYCVPPRPPLPPELQVHNEPIYSSINKGMKKPKSIAHEDTKVNEKMKDRPLPPPPIPPRPKSSKFTSSEALNKSPPILLNVGECSVAELRRSVSPCGVEVKDAAVSTKDNGFAKLYEKEVQTSFDEYESENSMYDGKDEKDSKPVKAKPMDVNANFAKNDAEKPATAALPEAASHTPVGRVISDNISIASSVTIGSYYDAEEEEEATEEELDDTFADVDSINVDTSTSQFVSFSEQTPTQNKPWKKKQSTDSQSSKVYETPRSHQSSETGNKSGSTASANRRKMTRNRREEAAEDSEDTDDLLHQTRNLQAELKQVFMRKANDTKDDVSDSDW